MYRPPSAKGGPRPAQDHRRGPNGWATQSTHDQHRHRLDRFGLRQPVDRAERLPRPERHGVGNQRRAPQITGGEWFYADVSLT
ncbi:hypothetical protein [Alloactinosynnema sp. L-07]|nr:hypothetical protein [Alloactinosynnema sp. L-07]